MNETLADRGLGVSQACIEAGKTGEEEEES
jgi:hypothetical protein